MIVIGVDCATDEKKMGLALGSVDNKKTTILRVSVGGKNEPVVDLIEKWLPEGQPALLALDSPLGWPRKLAQELLDHSAGMPLKVSPDHLFSRLTDHIVKKTIVKRPLEVGADRIARTAHSSLKLLQSLREKTGAAIPLAWEGDDVRETCAIEVYPAATLVARRINVQGYKKRKARDERLKLIELISNHLEIATSREQLESSSDAIDAVVCVLAASDFLLGKCLQPEPKDEETARKEGWIWVLRP
jgi:predicted RNase H-like nuclease